MVQECTFTPHDHQRLNDWPHASLFWLVPFRSAWHGKTLIAVIAETRTLCGVPSGREKGKKKKKKQDRETRVRNIQRDAEMGWGMVLPSAFFFFFFSPNGMQIAVCLSRQLWMCTTKQGAFEHAVTLLIMCWRNRGRQGGNRLFSLHTLRNGHSHAPGPGSAAQACARGTTWVRKCYGKKYVTSLNARWMIAKVIHWFVYFWTNWDFHSIVLSKTLSHL